MKTLNIPYLQPKIKGASHNNAKSLTKLRVNPLPLQPIFPVRPKQVSRQFGAASRV